VTAAAAVEAIPAAHRPILDAALRAPSAHNAQPWRLTAVSDAGGTPTGSYELHYDHTDYLPFDPDDRDAYLCMGALIETLALAAARLGHEAVVSPVFRRSATDLHVADIELVERTSPADDETLALAQAAADRHTNRSRYTKEPLPAAVVALIKREGGVLVDPPRMAKLVGRASKLSWVDRRFVADLERYCMRDESSPRGMTRKGLMLARYEWAMLFGAFKLGRLPGPIGWLFSSRDIRLLRTAPAVVVLGADSLDPESLVAAGRRLLRIWAGICGAGYGYHPISVSIDRRETAPEVAAVSGIAVPAAVFRVGRPTRAAIRSNRAALADVLEALPPAGSA
jgi:hypothetical protein